MNTFVTKIIQGVNFMCDIFRSKFITTIVLLFLGYLTISAQVSEVDSLEYEAIQDTIQMIIGDPDIDTNPVDNILDSVKLEDSLKSTNDYNYLQAKFDEYFSKKALKSHKNDTLYQLINKINFFIQEDSLVVSDSVFKALKKLQYYIENRDISNELHFLSNHIVLNESEHTEKQQLADTINVALHYVVNYLLKDSLNLTFRNSNKEKDFFYSEKGVADSIHIKLYDQRGEFVLLWIKKTPDNVFDLYLEDGVYLQKAKQRSAIQREIKTNQADISLKKINKVNIILPLWTYTGSIDLNFSQSYLSDWSAGGENSLSALSVLRYSIDLVYGKKIWDNDIEYKLGYLQAGEGPLQKNEDKFELNSKYGHAAFNNWYYSFLLNFKTQFLPGYDYPKDADPVPISGIMSPATLVFSLGLDYKPSNKFTLLLSPLTSKFTIFTDTVSYDQTRFGIEQDKKSKQEIGAYVKLLSKTYLRKDILLENRVTLFTNYIDNPQNVDVDWEAILSFEFTEYFKFKLNTHIIYDDNIDIPVYKTINGVKTKVGVTKKLQWKEVFSVGFSYKIFH